MLPPGWFRTASVCAAVVAGALALVGGAPPVAANTGVVPSGARGGDISWPNCPKGMGVWGRRSQGLPLPETDSQFFIVGLTNGRAFTSNPCLASHVQAASARGVRTAAYTMLSYPNTAERVRYGQVGPFGTTTYANQISNVGYAQTNFALDGMAGAQFAVPFVWIDVEPRVERRWSTRQTNNQALIAGAMRAIADRGLSAGIYTYAYAWKQITGNWQVALPLWIPSGSHARSATVRAGDAAAACARPSFTGGPIVMTQWVWRNRDYDVTCPAMATLPTNFFA